MIKVIKSKLVLFGLVGLAFFVATSPAQGQESAADIWARSCGNCHRLQPPNKYDADSWHAIMGHMALNARLTADEEEAVREWLMASARPLAQQTSPAQSAELRLASADPSFVPKLEPIEGADIYTKHCAACHGKEGKGDGPAAVALTPRPPDLTKAQRMGEMSDEQLLEVLTKGKGTMPGFSALLKPEELTALLAYVRSLSAEQ